MNKKDVSALIEFMPTSCSFSIESEQAGLPGPKHKGTVFINGRFASIVKDAMVDISLKMTDCLNKDFIKLVNKLNKKCTASVSYDAFFGSQRDSFDDIPNPSSECWRIRLSKVRNNPKRLINNAPVIKAIQPLSETSMLSKNPTMKKSKLDKNPRIEEHTALFEPDVKYLPNEETNLIKLNPPMKKSKLHENASIEENTAIFDIEPDVKYQPNNETNLLKLNLKQLKAVSGDDGQTDWISKFCASTSKQYEQTKYSKE